MQAHAEEDAQTSWPRLLQHALSQSYTHLDRVHTQGDPSAVPAIVENVKSLLGAKPMFGICMGHQILGQAVGGSTFKLKFGHHGGNHPIRYDSTGMSSRFGFVRVCVCVCVCVVCVW